MIARRPGEREQQAERGRDRRAGERGGDAGCSTTTPASQAPTALPAT